MLRLFFRALILYERGETSFHFEEVIPSQQECRVLSRFLMQQWILEECFDLPEKQTISQTECRLTMKLTQILLFALFSLSDLKQARQIADNKIKNLVAALNE